MDFSAGCILVFALTTSTAMVPTMITSRPTEPYQMSASKSGFLFRLPFYQPQPHCELHPYEVKVPCVRKKITLNGCKGACRSYSVPNGGRSLTREYGLSFSFSVSAHCCSVFEAKKVFVPCSSGDGGHQMYNATECWCRRCTNC
eukprot:m.144753 g.144753  ORF g.144753 m.144753 type:complete len:144 (+) comp38407_c1_seq1:4173-4604(+)